MSNKDLSRYNNLTKEDYQRVAGTNWPSYNDFQQHNNVDPLIYNEIDSMLWNIEKFNNPAFCVLPFFGTEVPGNVACCIMSPDYDINEVRQDMLNGVKTSACDVCWKLENQGIKSDRNIKNETLDFYFNKDIKLLFDDCVKNKNSIIHYKIDTNNTCNSTCVTCNSEASSAWAQLERKNGVTPKDTWNLKLTDLDNSIDYCNAKSINFRGGEPFLSSTNFDILEKLIAVGNTDCFISFTTNGSSSLSDYQKKLISKFKNVNFCFSIDGVGPVFEYLRFPLKWDTLQENFRYCQQNSILVSVSYTVSNLNILYHNQTVKWFNENNINFLTNPVRIPNWFSPASLPLKIKEYIRNYHPSSLSDLLLQNHSAADEHNYKLFCKKIKEQDCWKNISLKDYLPELDNLMVAYNNNKII